MATIEIETTQNVQVSYKVASLGERLLAGIIDYAIFIAYYIFALIFFLATQIGTQSMFLMVIIGFPPLIYDFLMEIIFNGQSVGKMIMGIKVIKIDGTQPTVGNYLIRHIFRLIDSPSFFTVMMGIWWLGIISILSSSKGQRLGDVAAGTTVIKLSHNTFLHSTILHYHIDPNYVPFFNSVNLLSDRDIGIIKELLAICIKSQNVNALQTLATKTAQVMHVQTNMRDIDFLNTVILDYSNYQFEPSKYLHG